VSAGSTSPVEPAMRFEGGVVAGFFDRDRREFERCEVPCVFGYHEAPDLVFERRREAECPLMKFGLWSDESEEHYPSLAMSEKNMKEYDLIGTPRLSSDVPALHGNWADYDFYQNVSVKDAPALAVVVISNCAVKERLAYLQELIDAGLKVDSIGACMNNGPRPGYKAWGLQKIEAIKPYKFYLSFESSHVEDYVTERFFQALVAGTVPVVYGTPNIGDFSPSNHSVIDTAKFKTAKDVVDHLKWLDENDEEYFKLLAWKREGVSEQFENLLASTTDIHFACRICMHVKNLLDVELGLKNLSEAFPDVPPLLGK